MNMPAASDLDRTIRRHRTARATVTLSHNGSPVAGQEVKIVTHGICYLDVSIDLEGNHIILIAYYGSCVGGICGTDTVSLGILGEDSYTLDYSLYDLCLSGQGGDSLVYSKNVNFDVLNGPAATGNHLLEDISLYPNPASHEVFVEIPGKPEAAELGLFNLGGSLVKRTVIRSPGRFRIDLSGVAAGYYLLRIRTGEKVYTGRVSVIK